MLRVNLLASPQLENIQLDIGLMGVPAPSMSLLIGDSHALDLKPYMSLYMCLVSLLAIEPEGV